MAATPPANLATNDIISEAWVDAVSALPAGEMARQTGISTGSIATIQTIFILTFTAIAGRRYRLRSQMQFAMGGSVGTVTASVCDAGNVTLQSSSQSVGAGFVGGAYVEHEVTPPAGAVTYNVRIVANAAAIMNGSATQAHWATVDDVGAA